MIIKTTKEGKAINNNYLVIFIRGDKYKVTESTGGKLCISKISGVRTDAIEIHPKCANVIELN